MCRSELFSLDILLATHAWGVSLREWPAHTPRLWSRRVLTDIEAKLAPFFAISRANKLRDAASDVSMHVQHELWMLAASDARTPGEAQVVAESLTKQPRKYFFTEFDDGADAAYWERTALAIARRAPIFRRSGSQRTSCRPRSGEKQESSLRSDLAPRPAT